MPKPNQSNAQSQNTPADAAKNQQGPSGAIGQQGPLGVPGASNVDQSLASDTKSSPDATPPASDQTTSPSNEQTPTPADQGSSANDELETKQAVITADHTSGRKPLHWQVKGFRGTFLGVQFDDDGFSDKPVPDNVAEAFHTQFPKADGRNVEVHEFDKGPDGKCDECGRAKDHSLHSVK